MFPRPYVVLDFETTGLGNGDRVIEIAALRLEGTKVTEFHRLCNPGCRLSSFIRKLTGLTDADLRDAPQTTAAIRDLYRLLLYDRPILVAHNVQFDHRFLNQELSRARLPHFQGDLVCTMALSRRLFPRFPSHRLPDLLKYLGISVERHHRALDDVKATRRLLHILLDKAHQAGMSQNTMFYRRVQSGEWAGQYQFPRGGETRQ